MSSTTDKIRGAANKTVGALKKGVGKATGNRELQAEGTAQEIRGSAQTTVGNAKQGVKNAVKAVKAKT